MIRHFALRLFLPILCTFIFAQAAKADEVIIGQLKYRLYDNWTAEVSANDKTISGDIVIPDEITYNDSKYYSCRAAVSILRKTAHSIPFRPAGKTRRNPRK